MGKRSDFERKPRDFYPTPAAAVSPLLPHIGPNTFIEPCAGDGALVRHLESFGLKCKGAIDIEPQGEGVVTGDALQWFEGSHQFITNPPWDRRVLHPIIEHLRNVADTWLLLDADWAYTKQSSPYMKYCARIIAVGRVKWIPDSKTQGKDNCAWYLFQKEPCETIFVGRQQ